MGLGSEEHEVGRRAEKFKHFNDSASSLQFRALALRF